MIKKSFVDIFEICKDEKHGIDSSLFWDKKHMKMFWNKWSNLITVMRKEVNVARNKI